jgi:NAD(P)-dependent dehydrogenase (short-subunit alcohol dehydrogenase family)
MTVEGHRVLVVGAGGGIGAATTLAFARAGAHVVAAGRPGKSLDASATAAKATSAEIDILDEAMIDRFFTDNAPFDHVVLAAASVKPGSVADLPLADAYAAMNSKFWGSYRVARSARMTKTGSLIFVSGFRAHRPGAGSALLGAINGALEALARGLAVERAPVRVNVVSPGIIDTPLHERVPADARKAMFEDTAAKLPVGRVGQPEDIAAAILFLAANPFVTGTTLLVDGGGTIA